MTDKMRESFEKWLDQGNHCGCNENMWKAWQAAQSAAVPEHIRSIKIPTDAMEQEFQKHYRRGYEAGKGDAVPVVGEAEALICDDCGAETNDPWHSSKGTNRHYHRCDSCNSISAAELDALRKDAERFRKLRGWMSSKALEDWYRVTELSGVFCYVSWEAGDSFLDGLPECNVGLMQKDAALAQGKGEK